MFNELIITALPQLVKFFETLNLKLYLSKPQIRHLQAFIVAMMLKGYGGKTVDVAELALHTHRTGVSRFLDSGGWDEHYLKRAMNKHVIDAIWKKARQSNLPIYIIIDDTICEKAKPSSQVKSHIYGCGYHKSHLKNKMVYGHQFVSCMLRCGDLVLPYDIVLYEKALDGNSKVMSKIDIAKEIIASLPNPVQDGYVLTDSWYSCQTLFEAAKARGYHFIGALKSNRLLFPKGFHKKGIKINKYAPTLRQSDFDLVTVGGHNYHVYTYLGRINGQKKVKVVISWPEGAFGIPKAMKAFISTDIEMNPRQLLTHYTKRWPIEVFFRESNRHLGMKQCQVRSKKAVIRYQYIVMLAYAFCSMEVSGNKIVLGAQKRGFESAIERFKVSWIFEQGKNGSDLAHVLNTFRLA